MKLRSEFAGCSIGKKREGEGIGREKERETKYAFQSLHKCPLKFLAVTDLHMKERNHLKSKRALLERNSRNIPGVHKGNNLVATVQLLSHVRLFVTP